MTATSLPILSEASHTHHGNSLFGKGLVDIVISATIFKLFQFSLEWIFVHLIMKLVYLLKFAFLKVSFPPISETSMYVYKNSKFVDRIEFRG